MKKKKVLCNIFITLFLILSDQSYVHLSRGDEKNTYILMVS